MGLASVASRMESTQAAKVCAQAADIFIAALDKETDSNARVALAAGLSSVASRMESAQAAKVCGPAADSFIAALDKEMDSNARRELAVGLASVVSRMESVQAADILIAALSREADFNARVELAKGLSAAAAGLTLDARDQTRHATVLAAGTFTTPPSILPSLALLHAVAPPQPLPAQHLVELLKNPFCVGRTRSAVLDVLEFTYKRPFKDQWEFVEYAQRHQPQLDLLSPPKRSEAKP